MRTIDFNQYTREEFVNFIKESEFGDNDNVSPENPVKYTCPELIGLEEDDEFCIGKVRMNCEGCWMDSIKNVKFKGE